ncbi:3'-5' exonuclease [Ferrimonas sediminicola]|uniref:3'-5' exonuclease n=1 Tax=Ferrimonas sediminicola TaxID=2569538 RepID=A0A4U1BHA5_9GAMM|nr:exonuclease domain-containing protein [Ferrimonas sediminicola]TKB50645.1 3'-5' exonuclease [Ferrimonas sediminicola]
MSLFSGKLWRWRWQAWRSGESVPVAEHLGARFRQLPLLALDLELTGLNPRQDEIVSIGAVPLDGGRIQCRQAFYQLVKARTGVGESATIHGIVDGQLEQALSPQAALARLWPLLEGRILVCHNAELDLAFLGRALCQCRVSDAPLLAVDTLELEKRRLLRQGKHLAPGDLTLAGCRDRYGLPYYPGHDALVDALACGELLMAQAAAMGGNPLLGELLGP